MLSYIETRMDSVLHFEYDLLQMVFRHWPTTVNALLTRAVGSTLNNMMSLGARSIPEYSWSAF